jgi:GH15 family glucan-1,4-alpha-glucosidase
LGYEAFLLEAHGGARLAGEVEMKRQPSSAKLAVAAATLLALEALGTPAHAAERTLDYLTTGNGHGFQVYSVKDNKVIQFLEHPYRYLRPRPADPNADGIARRNLSYDVYFGVRGSGGHGWLNAPDAIGEPSYVNDSHVILAPTSLAGIDAESYFFSPFGDDTLGNTMIAILKAPSASDGFLLLNFHMGNGEGDSVGSNGESLSAIAAVPGAVSETGPGGGAIVYVPLSPITHADCQGPYAKVQQGQDLGDAVSCTGDDQVLAYQQALSDGWMAVAVSFVENAADASQRAQALSGWGAGRSPEQILNDALAEFDAWRKPPPEGILCSDAEIKLWRQSEAVLRMGQSREAYTSTRKNNGMIIASLPRGNWHSGWVRDAIYAIVALARSGHHEEARIALDFFLNATPVGKYASYVNNVNYRISVVRYYGNGEEEADYSGQPSPNVEIDGWGMVMWAARQYVEASGDTAWLSTPTKLGPNAYDAIVSGIAGPLEQNLEDNGVVRADSSIWEVHDDNKRHYAYTTLAAARGFCDMAAIANQAGKTADVAKYQGLATKVKEGFFASFLDQNGAVAGNLETIQNGNYADGAVAEVFTWNILDDFAGDTASATIDLLNTLKVESGGWKRNNESKSSYDDNEWILVDFRILNSLRRNGRTDEADSYLATIIDKASANFYLLPELYNAVAADGEIGRYWGEIPMVGYGAGAYIMTILDRMGLIEPNDCGDGMGITLPTLTCDGVDTNPSGTGAGGGGTDGPASYDDLPYGIAACLCGLEAGSSRPSSAWLSLFGVVALVWRRRQRR